MSENPYGKNIIKIAIPLGLNNKELDVYINGLFDIKKADNSKIKMDKIFSKKYKSILTVIEQ